MKNIHGKRKKGVDNRLDDLKTLGSSTTDCIARTVSKCAHWRLLQVAS